MYLDFSAKKSMTFLGLIALLVISMAFTLSIKRNIPSEYLSLREDFRSFVLSIKELDYSHLLSFVGLGKKSDSTDLSGIDLSSHGDASEVPVLVYHGIVSKPDRFSMTAETFSDQMITLKKAGYRTVTLEDFYSFIQGQKKLPDKSFLLTFDDGRADSYEGADPILKSVGFNAVMFVATGDSLHKTLKSSSYYLDEIALHRMIDSGRWELGSHAIQENTKGGLIPVDSSGQMGNFLSNKMWLPAQDRLENDDEYKARVIHELSDSKADLENTFGIKIMALSYPFSDYGQQTVNNPNAVKVISDVIKTDYSFAFQQTWPSESSYLSNYEDMDDYHLRRVETGTTWTGEFLVKLLATSRGKTLPFTDSFETDSGWRSTWGVKSLDNGNFHIESIATSNGAFVFLDGTRSWVNYMYTVDVFREKGSHVSLVARFKDNNNNLACVFGDNDVSIQQKINGVALTITKNKNLIDMPYPKVNLGISVDGSSVKCYEGAYVVSYVSNVDSSLNIGGVGLQVWDSAKNNASLYASSLTAVAPESIPDLVKKLPVYQNK